MKNVGKLSCKEGGSIKALLLAAGLGTRLKGLTDDWPKCLMPVGGIPLLEHWIGIMASCGIGTTLVNVHHHQEKVIDFLGRSQFAGNVEYVYEDKLLGTAGTLRENKSFFEEKTFLLAHADNWCQCDFDSFVDYHRRFRPKDCPITMMTFETRDPEACGIVEKDVNGIVVRMHEKVANPPGNCANGAVYILEPEILEFLEVNPHISDFSTEVIPAFFGRIATWHNDDILRDIGTLESLQIAQTDPLPARDLDVIDGWTRWFESHPIHQQIKVPQRNSYS